jgi:hypothetical protein
VTGNVLWTATKSITCQTCGRYGVFTPADGFSDARIK